MGPDYQRDQGAARQLRLREQDRAGKAAEGGRIFISKAVILLCAARKSRDDDHLQNFVYDALAGIDADKLAAELLKAGKENVPTTRSIATR